MSTLKGRPWAETDTSPSRLSGNGTLRKKKEKEEKLTQTHTVKRNVSPSAKEKGPGIKARSGTTKGRGKKEG